MEDEGSASAIWREIERSESYLVCSMFEEAASSASSIVKRLCVDTKGLDDVQLYDMLESTGMVLVQSLNQLGRASEILNQLKQSFSLVVAIPAQVLLIGSCFQILENSSGVGETLQEFLSKWRFVDERYYVLVGAETNIDYVEGCQGRYVLGVDKYLELAELYTIKLLATTLNNTDLAVSWVEKAELPEDTRQGLLRRLHSLHSVNSSQGSSLPLSADNKTADSSNLKQLKSGKGSPEVLDYKYPLNREKTGKQVVLEPCMWWLRIINSKLSNGRMIISNRKIFLSCLILLAYWILRRKQVSLKRMLQRQALLVKNGVVDLWKLAFSYQVNPLAAIQSPPVALRGGH
ncbi:hypothetical protein UlMin_043613 [Ulmus minor]